MQTGFAPSPAVRDIAASPSDSTVYALDDSAVSAYRLKNGKLQLLPGPLLMLPAQVDGNSILPQDLAMDRQGESLYVMFKVLAGKRNSPTMLGVIHRNADGSLEPMAMTGAAPEEIHRIFAARADSFSRDVASLVVP